MDHVVIVDENSLRHLIEVLDRATIVGAGAQTHLRTADAVRRALPVSPEAVKEIQKAVSGEQNPSS